MNALGIMNTTNRNGFGKKKKALFFLWILIVVYCSSSYLAGQAMPHHFSIADTLTKGRNYYDFDMELGAGSFVSIDSGQSFKLYLHRYQSYNGSSNYKLRTPDGTVTDYGNHTADFWYLGTFTQPGPYIGYVDDRAFGFSVIPSVAGRVDYVKVTYTYQGVEREADLSNGDSFSFDQGTEYEVDVYRVFGTGEAPMYFRIYRQGGGIDEERISSNLSRYMGSYSTPGTLVGGVDMHYWGSSVTFTANAVSPTYTISGTVRSRHWPYYGLPGVNVTTNTGQSTVTLNTDGHVGEYTIPDVPGGNVQVTASYPTQDYWATGTSFSDSQSLSLTANRNNVDFGNFSCRGTPSATINVESDTVSPGETFNVTVYLQNNSGNTISNIVSYLDLSFEGDHITVGTPSGAGWDYQNPRVYAPDFPSVYNYDGTFVPTPHDYLMSASRTGGFAAYTTYSFTIPITVNENAPPGTFTLKYRGTMGDSRNPVSTGSGDRDQQGFNVNTFDVTISDVITTETQSWTSINYNGITYELSILKNTSDPSVTNVSLKSWGKTIHDIIIQPDNSLSDYDKYKIALAAENKLILQSGLYSLIFNPGDYAVSGKYPEQRTDDNNNTYHAVKSLIAEAFQFGWIYYDGWTSFGGLDNPNERRRIYRDILIELCLDTESLVNDADNNEIRFLDELIKVSREAGDNVTVNKILEYSRKGVSNLSKTALNGTIAALRTNVNNSAHHLKKQVLATNLTALLDTVNLGQDAMTWSSHVFSASLTQLSIQANCRQKLDLIETIIQASTDADPQLQNALSDARQNIEEMKSDFFNCLTAQVLGGHVNNMNDFTHYIGEWLVNEKGQAFTEKIVRLFTSHFISKNPKILAIAGGAATGVFKVWQSIQSGLKLVRYISLQLTIERHIYRWLSNQNLNTLTKETLDLMVNTVDLNLELGVAAMNKHLITIDGKMYSVFVLDPIGAVNFLNSLSGGYDDVKNEYNSDRIKCLSNKENLSNKYYFTSFEVNRLFEALFLDVQPPQAGSPSPSIAVSSWSGSRVGETVTITVDIANNGGQAGLSYFDVSCSNNIDHLNISPGEYLRKYNIGDDIWHDNGQIIPAENKLYSYVYQGFDGNTTMRYYIRFTSREAGQHWLKVRLSFGNADGDYEKYPLSGTVDQQGWYAIEIPVNVAANQAPIINSYSPVSDSVVLDGANPSQLFAVNASDPEGDAMEITWFFNDQYLKTGDDCIINQNDHPAGTYELKALVADYQTTALRTWEVVISNPCLAPSIVSQPNSQTIVSGETVFLSVSATGDVPIQYQWYRGNSGDTSSPVGSNATSYESPALTESASYWVRISNVCGTVDSLTASITVTPPPVADINVRLGGAEIPNGGGYGFGNVAVSSFLEETFILENTGAADLLLTDGQLSVTGTGTSQFRVTQQPATTISANGSSTFTVRFKPMAGGTQNASVSIASNDADENPFTLNLSGSGTITGAHISGRITDESGTGIENAIVEIHNVSGQWISRTVSDGAGYYITNDLVAGTYIVRFHTQGIPGFGAEWYDDRGGSEVAQPVVVTAGQITDNINAQLAQAGYIGGQVTDENGNPVPNMAVDVRTMDNHWLTNRSTDAEGNYMFNLPAGTYKVYFSTLWGADTYAFQFYDNRKVFDNATPLTIEVGQTLENIDAQLAPGVTVSGRVTDENGNGIPDVHVHFNTLDLKFVSWANTDSNGYYTAKCLPEGDYKVEFNTTWVSSGIYITEWYENSTSFTNASVISLSAAATPLKLDAQPATGGRITGTVTDAASGPGLENVWVEIVDLNNQWVYTANTNSDGSYSACLAPAVYKIRYRPQQVAGYYSFQWWENGTNFDNAAEVTVAQGQTTGGLDVALSAGGAVSGLVTDAATGLPLRDYNVSVNSTDNNWLGYAATDINGVYTIKGLPPGNCKIYYWSTTTGNYVSQWYNNKANFESADEVTILAGQVTGDINVDAVLAGTASSGERAALIALYNSTAGDSWYNNTGWKNGILAADGFQIPGTEHTWYGVSVENNHVVQISLRSNNLSGPIPSQLGNLPFLVLLELHYNNLSGSIPPQLGDLSALQRLHLGINQLSGSIPKELGNLTQLTFISLQANPLTGVIPPELGNLANLRELTFYLTQLSGPIPPQLGALTLMERFELSCSNLSGDIPDQLANMTRLKRLNLGFNNLNPGPIPSWVTDLTDLEELYLHHISRTGSIPGELQNLTKLRWLGLSGNQLTGTIPQWLSDRMDLERLELYGNQLTGTIPAWLGSLTKLRRLQLASNNFSGQLPDELLNLVNLDDYQLDLRWNALYTDNQQLIDMIESKQLWSDWGTTQTIAPTSVSAEAVNETSVELSWVPIAYTADSGCYSVFYSTSPGGPYLLKETPYGKNTASCPITGLQPDTDYYFVIRTRSYPHGDNQNIVDSAYSEETAIRTPVQAQITVTSPNGGESWQAGTSHNITWSSSGVPGPVDIEYSGTGAGGTFIPVAQSIANTGSYLWTVSNVDSALCVVRISAETGTAQDVSDGVFTITVEPVLTVISPNGGEHWESGTSRQITWTASNVSGDVVVEIYKGNIPAVIMSSVSASAESLTWNIPADFAEGDDYGIRIHQGGLEDYSDSYFSIGSQRNYVFHGSDYNGDGISDIAIFRPANGRWCVKGQPSVAWGTGTDIPVPGDYDGNGSTDMAVFRPSTGRWCIMGQPSIAWGTATDIPIPGDYNGDGTTDIAIYRPSNGRWCVMGQPSIAWGTSEDIPVPADYNGDGTTDIAVFRPSNGRWCVMGQPSIAWGIGTDIPVPADYDGDGDADITIFRPSTGRWCIMGQPSIGWGTASDIPVPADFDGDGNADIAIFRSSNGAWSVMGSSSVLYGTADDVPLVSHRGK
ncbi:MAG: choice-of-anchor D domain-containing protein [bacterium]|nr:choice-of-anchor D domain-containing protein [bacterium]